ncbi:MAG: energy transducer TonB [Bacteroidales bacterium]|nr:energy transducer TonB [Bacteroidales bacterium]
MAKDIDLNSQKWMDLIFEGKNKSYGAYVLRDESSNRHLKALVIVFLVGLAAIYVPGWISSLIPEKLEDEGRDNYVVTEVELSNIESEVPEENIIREIANVPPPPVLKQTIQFTPPVIAKDEEVGDEDLMATQQELTDSNAAISVATVAGVSEGGIDIADLEDNKVIVQAEVVEPFSHVEQMPRFGSGDQDLMEYLTKNIKYPPIAAEQGIQGTVVLRFVVNPDGSVSNVEVIRPLNPNLDKEAVRVVSSMPKWRPGEQNGVKVPVYYSLPVRFRLAN